MFLVDIGHRVAARFSKLFCRAESAGKDMSTSHSFRLAYTLVRICARILSKAPLDCLRQGRSGESSALGRQRWPTPPV